MTHPGGPWIACAFILRGPLDCRSAIDAVDVLTASLFVHVINPGRGHWPIFRTLIDGNRPRARDVTDTWLAAAALEVNATVPGMRQRRWRTTPGLVALRSCRILDGQAAGEDVEVIAEGTTARPRAAFPAHQQHPAPTASPG